MNLLKRCRRLVLLHDNLIEIIGELDIGRTARLSHQDNGGNCILDKGYLFIATMPKFKYSLTRPKAVQCSSGQLSLQF